MRDSISISDLIVQANGYEYICDFDAFYEPINPDAKLWRSDGSDAPDIGQDFVNFYYINITKATNLEFNSNSFLVDTVDERINLSEVLLAWCNHNTELHIEAFKQWKNAE